MTTFQEGGRLAQLTSTLWPDARVRHERRVPGAGDETYVVLPAARRPRLLVPVENKDVASGAIAKSSIGSNRRARQFRSGVASVARAGLLGSRWVWPRLNITRHPSDPGVVAWARAHAGGAPTSMAVRIGSVRANEKPVAQLMRDDGDVTSYAKIGTTSLTRHLVHHEADVLRKFGPALSLGGVVRPPRVLGSGRLGERELLVLEPLDLPRHPEAPAHTLVAAMKEIAGVAGVLEQELVGSSYVDRLRRRILAVEPLAGATASRSLDRILATHGGQVLRFGAWHGDFRPWNVALGGGQLMVWDWERFDRDVPLGLDAIHYHHEEVEPGVGRAENVGRLRRTATASAGMLSALRVQDDVALVLTRLHLLELALRRMRDASFDPAPKPSWQWALHAELAGSLGE